MRRLAIVVAVVPVLALVTNLAWAQPPGGQRGPGGRFGGPGPLGPPMIRVLDVDGNGEISAEELAAAAKSLAKLDSNSDGKLSPDEMFAGGPGGPAGQGGPGGRRMDRPSTTGDASMFEGHALAKNDAEKKILDVLNEMDQNQRRGMMNVPEEDGRLLRLLAESIGAKNIVEIGTSNGYSGIWFCLALRTTGGKLTTHEIDAGRAAIARQNFKRAGVEDMITLVEGDAHEEVAKLKAPIDLLFLDADKEGYIDYLEKLLPLVRPGGLIVAHNMTTRQAHPPFVKAITTNPDLETLFLHMQGAGVAVTLKKR